MFFSIVRRQATPAYTALLNSIKVDLKLAMKAKQNTEKNTIRAILSTIKNNEIDGGEQSEFELSKVLNKMIKQRIVSANEYQQQNRTDLAEVETQESDIIRKYVLSLPVASEEEITKKIVDFLTDLKAKDSSMHVGAIFKQITDELANTWGAAPSVIKSKIPQLYKDVFQKWVTSKLLSTFRGISILNHFMIDMILNISFDPLTAKI